MDLKTAARVRFDAVRPAVIDLSHRIHAHPELGFEEEQASTWLSEILTSAAFTVDRGICDLPTRLLLVPAVAHYISRSVLSTIVCPASATPAATT
jgi:metal-dependent amidase/aminoacylase/carboxypeptidase family protein